MTASPYDTIASLYDEFVQTTLDIPFFLDEARQTPGDVLDLMAGTGRVSLPLIQAGCRVTCVDNSAEMLAVLREKLGKLGLAADVRQMDVRRLALDKRFDLILIPFHAFAELASASDQQQTLSAVYAHLSEGGRFICALHNPAVRLKSADGQLRLIGKYPRETGRLLVWLLQTYDPENRLVEINEMFEQYDWSGRMVEKHLMEMRVTFVEYAEFEAMARAAGFKTLALYGDYSRAPFDAHTSPFMIWVLGRAAIT